MLRNFFAREDRSVEGQTLVEYALIIALVSIVLAAALTTLAGGIGAQYTSFPEAFTPAP